MKFVSASSEIRVVSTHLSLCGEQYFELRAKTFMKISFVSKETPTEKGQAPPNLKAFFSAKISKILFFFSTTDSNFVLFCLSQWPST